MRRLPVYFLIDVSESMVGEPCRMVEDGMRSIIQELRTDPYALETVFVSVIAFAGKAVCLTPLTEVYKFYPPKFPVGGGTSLGKALEMLMDDMDRSLVKTTASTKGDWKPIIFLFTDGNPTDRYQKAFERWNRDYRNHCSLVAVSIGDNLDVLTLGQITSDVLLLKETSKEAFSEFFRWVTASICASSQAVSEGTAETIKLGSQTINLEKVDLSQVQPDSVCDEHFVVVHGKCQNTGNEYLVKFARSEDLEWMRGDRIGSRRSRNTPYQLVGAYPIDGKEYASLSAGGATATVSSNNIYGNPTCPCCGNAMAMCLCECGRIFCVSEVGEQVCPWCGAVGDLGIIGDEGADVARGLG